ncbi:hypothetical protein BCR44DRAFT_51342 [Catenaria anguillulae PL171]|uniref:Uncharacterized protein n=1 Tax=Catenaria anguillulae PL171 TaxID=765915 RepID=A0A1Y2I1N6_9FUNG|nr:hypothetical protein BCR44DRAFT_51342 [Catenaria anguillulae PL171]
MSSSPFSRRSFATNGGGGAASPAIRPTTTSLVVGRDPRRESLGLFDSLVDQSADCIDNLTFDDLASEDTEPLPQCVPTRALKDVAAAAAASAAPAAKPKENKSPFFFANWSPSDESDCDGEDDDDNAGSSASFDPDQTIVPGDVRIKRMSESPTRSPQPPPINDTRAVRHSLSGGGAGGGGESMSLLDQTTPVSSRKSYATTPSSSSTTTTEPRSTTPSQPGTLEDIRRRLARIKNAPPLPVTAEPSQLSLSTSADIVVPDFHSSPSVSSRHSVSNATAKPSTPKRLPAVPLDLQAPTSTSSTSSRRLSSIRSQDLEPAPQAPTPYTTQSQGQRVNMRGIQEDDDQEEHIGDQTIMPTAMQPLDAPARHSPMPQSSLSTSAYSVRSTPTARQSLSTRERNQSTPIQMSSTVLLNRPSSHEDDHVVVDEVGDQQASQFTVHSPAPVRASPSVPAVGLSAARRSASSSPAPLADANDNLESKVSSRPSLLALRQKQQEQQQERRMSSSSSSQAQADPSSHASSPRRAISSSLGPRPQSATGHVPAPLTKSASTMSLRTSAAVNSSGLRSSVGAIPSSTLGPRTNIPPSQSAMSSLSSLAKPSSGIAPPSTGLPRPGQRPTSMLTGPSSRLPGPGAPSPSLAGPSAHRANPATVSSLNAGNALRRSASMDLARAAGNPMPTPTAAAGRGQGAPGARMGPSPSLSNLAGAAGIVRPSSSSSSLTGANGQAPTTGGLRRGLVPPSSAGAAGSRLQAPTAPSGLRAPGGIPAPGGSGLRAPVAGRK